MARSGAGVGAEGCLHAVYITGDGLRPQRKPARLVKSESTTVTSALHGLAAQCTGLRADSASNGGMGQAALHPPLLVHVGGVCGAMLEACNAQLAAAGVPHRMLEW